MSDAILRLRRIARPMSYLVTAAMVLLPLALIIAALSGAYDEAYLRSTFSGVTLPEQIGTFAWIVIYGIAILSVGLILTALWQMRTLFSLYAMGDVFGPDAARAIRQTGLTLLVLAAVGVIGNTLIILALTTNNPAGQRALSIGFSSDDIFLFFTSGLLVAIGWAMSEATRIADENKGFV
ncbi:hypothetical protein [Gymnodinialimonas hymeniacidonis]|uniref:hypothetical protein n=1 Tax=Gymnodinialimonas hymeniacidonis TaxID=3126508 RepID=UPI0034C678E8